MNDVRWLGFDWGEHLHHASDVPSRVDGMAAEIAKARPDLVGLQEVAIWRAVYPPTFSPTGFDFLELLLDALAARGEHYVVVATT